MERLTINAGGPVSLIDHGGDGPLIVCVHGLEGSAYNWNLIAPHLGEHHQVVAPDLSGFGYTAPLGDDTTVERNAQLVGDIIDHYGGEALLIGNSMGGLISILVAELYPDKVNGLVLIDPAAPVHSWFGVNLNAAARLSVPLLPIVGRHLVTMYRDSISAQEGVAEALDFVAADADRLDPTIWNHALEIAQLRRTQPWATDALVAATNSIAPYVLRKARFADLIHRVTQPTLLVHGNADRLIQPRTIAWMARQRPDWTTVFFEGLGHVPMLEDPDRLLAVFDTWESATFLDVPA